MQKVFYTVDVLDFKLLSFPFDQEHRIPCRGQKSNQMFNVIGHQSKHKLNCNDMATHPAEWIKVKRLALPKVGEDVRRSEK